MPRALPYAGLAGIATSVALIVVTGLLGPSAVQPPLSGGSGPPFALDTHPSAPLVLAMISAALLLGAAGLGMTMWAARHGWSPSPRRLFLAGVLAALAVLVVPPMGSADHLSYAAYGHIAAIGHDPYATPPEDLAARGDPVARAVEPPWTWAPSVYGPVATAEQAAVAWVAGGSVRLIVFLLSVVGAAAYLATGALLHALARGDRGRQVRAGLLWTLNPLLLYELVAGAHVDTLAIFLGVAAVVALRRSTLGSGALLGAAASVKAPLALVGAGLLWGVRGSWRRVAAVIVGAAIVTGVGYALAGPHVFDQVNRASRYISLGTPWHPVAELLDPSLGKATSRPLVKWLSFACGLAVAAVLLHGLPRDGAERTGRARELHIGRVVLAFGLGWLLTAPYALPWYDGLAWAFLVALPWSRFDALLLVRTTVLGLAYVPGLVGRLPEDLGWTITVFRAEVTPVVTTALLLVFVAAAAGWRGRVGRAPRRVPAP